MASAIPRDRLRKEAMNFIPATSVGKINRYAGGGHGGGANVHAEEIPMMDAAQLARMEEDQILEGIEEFADGDPRHGSTHFKAYFQKSARENQMPTDMMEALAEEQEPTLTQQDRGEDQERDGYGDLDTTQQGESPASGHRPVAAGKLNFKQRVYIASLDVLGSVYEDNGNTVTVKTVHGKWIDVSKKDVEVINAGINDGGTGTPTLSPRKVNQEDGDGEVRDEDNGQDSMSAFSERRVESGTYADRRRARR